MADDRLVLPATRGDRTIDVRVHPRGLGLGIAIPTAALHVVDNSTADVAIFATDETQTKVLLRNDAAPADWGIVLVGASDVLRISKQGSGQQELEIDASGNLRIEGHLRVAEVSDPTGVANYGYVYAKSTNTLWFMDGAGAAHLVQGDAHGALAFNDTDPLTITISTQQLFTEITAFNEALGVDSLGNVTGSTSTNDLVIGTNAAGDYDMGWTASATSSGAAAEMCVALGIVLNSAKSISAATNASPIVITSTAHTIAEGDMFEVENAAGNTAANGSWIAKNVTADTAELYFKDGTASTGNGAYTGSGQITRLYPKAYIKERKVSQTDVGAASGGVPGARRSLVAGDKVKLYVMNVDSTANYVIKQVSLGIERMEA